MIWQLVLQASAAICLLFVDAALAQGEVEAITTDLDSLYAERESAPGAIDEDMSSYAKTSLVWKDTNKLLVEVIAAAAGAESLLRPAFEATDFEKTACSEYQCSGYLLMENYPDLVAFSTVKFVHASFPIASQAGSKISEALQSLRVDGVRTGIGLDGTGLKIGILSDSYDVDDGAPTSAADDVVSGDLPNNVVLVKEISNAAIGIDEGRAMAQLVHDLAPGAELYFRTAFDGPDDFAVGIQQLADLGCDVIVDDIGELVKSSVPRPNFPI